LNELKPQKAIVLSTGYIFSIRKIEEVNDEEGKNEN